MRKMLKWIAALMALAMLLSVTAAFAEPVTPTENDLTAKISVPIHLVGTAPVREGANPEGYRLKLVPWDNTNPLPDGAEEVTVQRIVCRADLTFNLAEAFVTDFRECLEDLKHAHVLCNEEKTGSYGFTH